MRRNSVREFLRDLEDLSSGEDAYPALRLALSPAADNVGLRQWRDEAGIEQTKGETQAPNTGLATNQECV